MSINNTLYSVDVLVNGNTCKQYTHEGKKFIEAKDNSEYEIKINNGSWTRILAVSSVDGLDVLTGETATEDSNGYVINGYDSLRIKGFRYSDEKVGAFKFAAKNKSYADGKGQGENVGVIGIRLFSEILPPIPITVYNYPSYTTINPNIDYFNTFTSNSGGTYNTGYNAAMHSVNSMGNNVVNASYHCSNNSGMGNSMDFSQCLRSSNLTVDVKSRGFDMGTEWGKAKESKVKEVEFKKGIPLFSHDIYYASRESLLEMGVPLGNESKVSFPSSFTKKYANPPRDWRG